MLAILTTHPIQYQVPLWQALARDGRVPFEVWYLTRHGIETSHDREFGQAFAWDLDTLTGYPSRFLEMAPGATPADFWACRLRGSLQPTFKERSARALWVQGWQVLAYWQAVREAHATGMEVWLRGESNDLAPVSPWKRAAKGVLLGQLFSRVDHFLCIGTANRRLYRQFGVSEGRLHPAPYAVDNDRFAAQAVEARGRRAEIRARWGIPGKAFCVLFCGKFIAKKRPLDLVAASQYLKGRGQDIHLLFVGSGALEAELRGRCAANGIAASFTGFLNQTQISEAYVAADCLALPSDFGETWGLVVNEAMASGLPCAVSDECGCAEDLGRQLPNVVFRCGSIEALGGALTEIRRADLSASPVLPTLEDTVATVVSRYRSLSPGSA